MAVQAQLLAAQFNAFAENQLSSAEPKANMGTTDWGKMSTQSHGCGLGAVAGAFLTPQASVRPAEERNSTLQLKEQNSGLLILVEVDGIS